MLVNVSEVSTADDFMNPDAIVALATIKVLGSSNPNPKNSLRHGEPDFQRGLKHGDHIDNRTATVLDSIAAICISATRSSVVAAALKLSLPKIQLIPAANDEREIPRIVEHLTKVWNLLKCISDLAHSNLNQRDVNMNVETPDKPSNSVAEKLLLDDLYSHVSIYSRAVVLKRFKKHRDTPAKLINITNDAIKQYPNEKIDVNVNVNGEMRSK